MFVRSKKARTTIFHHDHCRYAKRIKSVNIVYAHNQEDFVAEGYEECPYCGRLANAMKTIMEYAEKLRFSYGLVYDFRDGAMYVLTNLSAWKIVVEPGGVFALFHQNGHQRPRGHGVLPYRLRAYHDQRVRARKGFGKLLGYIIRHDTWKTNTQLSVAATHKKQSRSRKPEQTSVRHNRDHRRRLQTYTVLDMLDQIAEMRSGLIPKQSMSVADFVREMGE
jgi:hypothetical protein